MNQKKIGSFMKELRNEKQITQEQLSEILGVSNRTISRWETGSNLPDILLLMEISDFYHVDIRELLDGERKNEKMNENSKETILKVSKYDMEEKLLIMKKIHRSSIIGMISLIMYLILLGMNLTETPVTDLLEGFTLGVSLGCTIISFICTSRYGIKLVNYKLRIAEKLK